MERSRIFADPTKLQFYNWSKRCIYLPWFVLFGRKIESLLSNVFRMSDLELSGILCNIFHLVDTKRIGKELKLLKANYKFISRSSRDSAYIYLR